MDLVLVGDAGLSKDGVVFLWLGAGAEFELLLLLPFENDTDQKFHAETNDPFFVWVVNIDGIWQLDDSLQQACFDEAAHDISIGDSVELERRCAIHDGSSSR